MDFKRNAIPEMSTYLGWFRNVKPYEAGKKKTLVGRYSYTYTFIFFACGTLLEGKDILANVTPNNRYLCNRSMFVRSSMYAQESGASSKLTIF
jgi:hypothetical protein